MSFSRQFLDESVALIQKLDDVAIEAVANGLAAVRAARSWSYQIHRCCTPT